jgi:ubiquitin C-terminal hydrolase
MPRRVCQRGSARRIGGLVWRCVLLCYCSNVITRHCPHCKVLRKATKQLSLSRLPPILLIHLKRFSHKGVFTDKIETVVDFPLKGLDLTNYMPSALPPGVHKGPVNGIDADDPRVQTPPYKYDLYGVTNHFGSLSNGHCELTVTLTVLLF